MNKAYKVVYNESTGTYVAVSELETSKGKATSISNNTTEVSVNTPKSLTGRFEDESRPMNTIHYPDYSIIAGKPVRGEGEHIDVINPATAQVLSRINAINPVQFDTAVGAAQAADASGKSVCVVSADLRQRAVHHRAAAAGQPVRWFPAGFPMAESGLLRHRRRGLSFSEMAVHQEPYDVER